MPSIPTFLLLSLVATCAVLSAAEADKPQPGQVVLAEHPADPAVAAKWSHPAWARVVPEGEQGQKVLRVEVPAAPATPVGGSVQKDVMGRAIALTNGQYELARPLDLKGLKGWRVDVTARIRTAGVPVPAAPWDGVRLGIGFATSTATYNSNLNSQPGDSPWHEATLRVRIPADATAATLFVGLISSAGTLWIDEVRIVRVEPPLTEQIDPMWKPPGPAAWRGTGTGGVPDGWFETVGASWGVNLVKLWLPLPSPDLDQAAFDAALDHQLVKMEGNFARADAAGIKLIPQVTITETWKVGTLGGTHRMYLEPAVAERFVAAWERIARRWAGRRTIWGYDVLNETVLRVTPAVGCPDWEGLAERTARAINAIDPQVRIVVQPEEWWGMRAFEKLRPIDARNVVYSLHMYQPFELTHQGVASRLPEGVRYPGLINGVQWNKERLREALQTARDFQLAHHAKMQVGEFSCIRWAPDGSAGRWLADCIALFEEYGWDWTYHGTLDWDGWSVEMGEDPKDTSRLPQPGPAKRALLDGFHLNHR